MKKIIASSDQKDPILRKLSRKNHGIVTDTQIIPLSTFLKEEKDDDLVLSIQLSNRLLQAQEHFPIYQAMFLFPVFIQEILSFAKECILYSISVDDLPETNANEKELKEILNIAFTLDFAEKDNVKNGIPVSSNSISLHYQFIKDFYHYDIYEKLKKTYDYEAYPSNTPDVSLKYALNARSEAEAIAQDICRKQIPCNVILSTATALPLYEAVFRRYNIPFSSLRQSKPLHLPLLFKSLILFGIHKDRKSFLEALKYNAFSHRVSNDTYAFLRDTLTTYDLPDPINLENTSYVKDIEKYQASYEKAQAYYDLIQDEIDNLLTYTSIHEFLFRAFDIVRKSSYLKDPTELQAGISMRQTIIECEPYIQTEQDLLFLARCFETLHSDEQVLQSDFCVITDLTHPVEPKQISYVCSVSGANYPSVPKCSGLFDESYVEKIAKYPSRSTRYQLYMDQLSWIENSAEKKLIYSTYTNDYQGKEIQLAFEIENKYPDMLEKWDLVSLSPDKKKNHALTEETAKKLFAENNCITGSISTIERYFACPYSYFIQSGLKVRKQDQSCVDARTVGNMQHELLETSVKEHGKDYSKITEEQIRTYLKDAFDVLDALHPTETIFNQITKERIVHGIQQALVFLNDFENHTSFKIKSVEHQFHEQVTEHVDLVGKIDRIDHYGNELIRILDYKSSSKSLIEAQIKSGQQLQLMTYMMIAKKLYNVEPAGAYYYSLKDESYQADAKKVVKKEIEEQDWSEEAELVRMLNERRLRGFTFTKRLTEMDDDEKHIVSLKTQMSYELIEECLKEIYEYFYTHVTQGEIDLSPTDNACLYCDYKTICRFHGERRKPAPISCEDISFKVGKEEA